MNLIHVFSATLCTTAAWNLVIFDVKFVIVGQLLARYYSTKCEDDDVLLPEDVDDFRVAVGLKMNRELARFSRGGIWQILTSHE